MIQAKRLHTTEMVDTELRLFFGPHRLSLRRMMAFAVHHSPLLFPGDWTSEQLSFLVSICGLAGESGDKVVQDVVQEWNACQRAFEIIQPKAEKGTTPHSKIDVFSPEWFADMVSCAAQAVPGASLDDILDMSLCLCYHLICANGRRNGMITARPDDLSDALAQLANIDPNIISQEKLS